MGHEERGDKGKKRGVKLKVVFTGDDKRGRRDEQKPSHQEALGEGEYSV